MQTFRLGKHFSLKDIFVLLAGVIFFFLAGYIHHTIRKPAITISKQSEAINVNKDILLFLSAGNKRLMADLLWVQTLLESDEEHYSKKDLNSWMYLRFLNIATLDPRFYENYLWGGLYLSIIKDDLQGSAEIFERGIERFPADYQLNYYAGFNYYFEIGDDQKGLKFLEKIQHYSSSPPFIKFLVQKLKFETSYDYQDALLFLKNNYGQTSDPTLRNKILSEIYALQTEIDLKCLNAAESNCNLKDIEGNPYLKKNSTWVAPKEFTPYRIHRRKK